MQTPTLRQPTKLSQIPHHSYIQFSEPNQPQIFFNSKFDSGNLNKVIKNNYDHYSIWTASDAEGSQFQGYPKSWFYFQVGGFKSRKVTFSVHRVHFLWAMINRSYLYRPVYRTKKLSNQSENTNQQKYSQWQRLHHPIQSLFVNSEQQLVLKFDFQFQQNTGSVQFAFIYPYSHTECLKDILQLQARYKNDKDILFKNYELCRSYQDRIINMLIISSHQGKEGYENIKTDGVFSLGQSKIIKFRNNKPIIFISARVHPIQTPSSYTINGIIQFLLDKQDYRAHLLRKYFVFVLVPMLNPDGVSNGHCRMDSLNQNLNRYYQNSDPIKQPSCYSVIKICQHYNKDERLFMYLDLHAHPANKGNFIFGNAIFQYIQQVQSHLFPKILSKNCINFQFQQCNFSRKHMKAKDKNEDMNKQGCGRVVFYKQFGLTHSYTLQCGYHCNTYSNTLQQQQNSKRIYIVRYKKNQKNQHIYDNYQEIINEQDQKNVQIFMEDLQQKKNNNGMYYFKALRMVKDNLDSINDEFYKKQVVFFQPKTFYNLGRNICITLLDIWNKNPYTRIVNLNQQRKQIAEKQAKLDRFRKQQVGIRHKQKRIVQLIQTQFYAQWHKKNIFQIQSATGGFKRNQTKNSANIKRTQKSLTLTQAKQEILNSNSVNKVTISKSMNRNKKVGLKEQKKIKVVQPNIESIKLMVGIDLAKGTTPLRTVFDTKSFFKPLNIRIKNIQANKL